MEDSLDLSEDCQNKKGRWTKEEDEMLRLAVEELGDRQWKAVAERVPSRTTVQCFHRWTKILRPGLVKGPWTPTEDSSLVAWVQREGPTKWTQCSENIPGRTGKQCRERWFNTLDPDIKKGDWTDAEDRLMHRMYQKMGPRWTEIAKCLPGRTENSIKNRYYSEVRKAKHKTPEELRRITESRLSGSETLVSKATSVSMQVVALFQQMQALECLLNSTRQQILNLEETIEMEEQSLLQCAQNVLN